MKQKVRIFSYIYINNFINNHVKTFLENNKINKNNNILKDSLDSLEVHEPNQAHLFVSSPLPKIEEISISNINNKTLTLNYTANEENSNNNLEEIVLPVGTVKKDSKQQELFEKFLLFQEFIAKDNQQSNELTNIATKVEEKVQYKVESVNPTKKNTDTNKAININKVRYYLLITNLFLRINSKNQRN